MVRRFSCLLTLMGLLAACSGHLSSEPELTPSARLHILKSQKDLQNRYSSIVRVNGDDGICSGVLLASNLVLTSAHCVCHERKGDPGETVMDGADCQKTAKVETVIYESADEDDLGVVTEYEGNVVVNGGFKLIQDGQFTVISIHADLAVVRLNKEKGVKDVRAVRWRDRSKVLAREFIFMVGYGYFERDDKRYGHRRYGPNTVTAVDGEKFKFTRPGAHSMEGDSGGACIRETKDGPELIGIISAGGAPEIDSSTCTNTYSQPVQDWLKEQLKLASDAS